MLESEGLWRLDGQSGLLSAHRGGSQSQTGSTAGIVHRADSNMEPKDMKVCNVRVHNLSLWSVSSVLLQLCCLVPICSVGLEVLQV